MVAERMRRPLSGKKTRGRGEQVKSKTEGIEDPLAAKTIDSITPTEKL